MKQLIEDKTMRKDTGINNFIHLVSKVNSLPPKFKDAYEAGFDCGLHGANNFNSHYQWFRTKESLKEWELGKRNAEQKNNKQ